MTPEQRERWVRLDLKVRKARLENAVRQGQQATLVQLAILAHKDFRVPLATRDQQDRPDPRDRKVR